MNGYIKLYRSILNWEWYDDIPTKVLFLHILLKASRDSGSWHNIEYKKGQLITSYQNLARETGLSVQNIRTALKKLSSTRELTHNQQGSSSVITVNNWERFQGSNTRANAKVTTSGEREKEERERDKSLSLGESDKKILMSYAKRNGARNAVAYVKALVKAGDGKRVLAEERERQERAEEARARERQKEERERREQTAEQEENARISAEMAAIGSKEEALQYLKRKIKSRRYISPIYKELMGKWQIKKEEI